MDEATSSVDNQTDTIVQRVLKQEFAGSTTLTIAHRLHTIIDYHQIVVLDAGRCVEAGSPRDLVQDASGFLSQLIDSTSPAVAAALRRAALAGVAVDETS